MASTNSRNKSDKKSIALCQICPVIGNTEANKVKVVEWMRRAALARADLALFGELALTGRQLENLRQVSETRDGPAAQAIAAAAKEFGIAVIYGYSEIENNDFYNSLKFIDKDGTSLANYRKIHICEATPAGYKAGDAVTVVDWENLRVGLGIGEDVCFPEFFRAMVLNGGAQLVAVSAALSFASLNQFATTVFVPARALENRCYIAHTDLAGEAFLGMTKLFKPFPQGYQESPNAQAYQELKPFSNGVHESSNGTAEVMSKPFENGDHESLNGTADVMSKFENGDHESPNGKSELMLLAEVPLFTSHGAPCHYLSYLRPEIYDGVIPYATEVPWNRQTEERTQEFFNHRADYYDRQMDQMYNAPSVVARGLSEVVTNKNGRLLDIAAGTGLIGQALHKMGFRNIAALDRNKKMLEKAAAKNIYHKLIVGAFETEAAKLASGSFHACVCVGAFLTEAWLDPMVTVQEMSRLVESGGYLLLSWNATEFEEANCQAVRKNLDAALKEIVSNGECECLKYASVPNYLEECEGTLCILRKN